MIHTERAKWQWRRLRAMPVQEIASRASRLLRGRAFPHWNEAPRSAWSLSEAGGETLSPRPLFWFAGLRPEERQHCFADHALELGSEIRAIADRIAAGEVRLFS